MKQKRNENNLNVFTIIIISVSNIEICYRKVTFNFVINLKNR